MNECAKCHRVEDIRPHGEGGVCFACATIAEVESRLSKIREAGKLLLSGHDNLYVAHFGPQSNPEDDIAAKPMREALDD